MAGSSVSSSNKTTRFQTDVRKEYVREGRFGPYIGADENSIIQTNKNLKKTSIPLVGKLSGSGVSGSSTLTGNEEALSNYAATGQPTYWRNGVLIDNEERELSEFDLFQEARPSLMNWTMEKKRDQIIQAMGAIEAGGTYYNYGGSEGAYGSSAASAANMDTWNANNGDRILYGAAKGNRTAGDHTASLATIDTTNDKLDADMIALLKRMAKNAAPLIRPKQIRNDEPMFVFFVGSYAFRDLRADLDARQQNALPRNKDQNPIWTGGDLYYDGVIIKEVPEIDSAFIDGDGTGSPWDGVWGANATGDSLATAGDSSSRVGVGFFCGAQAVAMHIGRMAGFKRRAEDDYDHLSGVGVTMKHDIKKIFYNNKQHGMITSFHSAAADS
jgi:hypothetical protein